MSRTVRLVNDGAGILIRVDGVETVYAIKDACADPRCACPAWELEKEDGTVYHVAIDKFGPTCDCADCTFRQKACKHILSLQALGLLDPQPMQFPP